MMMKRSVGLVVVIALATSAGGCAPTLTASGELPQMCTQNNTATGAVIGTLLGAAIGGAIGGGRGALIGAGSGMFLGGLTGAQADAQCRQLAVQRAMDLAAQQAAAQQAAIEQARAEGQAAAYQSVAYQSVDYVTPTTGQRHKITPLNSYTDPATKEHCHSFSDVTFNADGTASTTGSGTACKSSDGKWQG